ncbi:MAG: sensor histidine kinase [Planctomycetota bacterium]
MRIRRYLLLGAAVLLAFGALAAVAIHSARAVARERAAGLARTLTGQVDAYEEHALFLADKPLDVIERHLRSFDGLARVRFTGNGEAVRVERFGYIVATLPDRRPLRSAIGPGFGYDDERLDVHPRLRQVFHYVVARPGGMLELTVYADRLLAPLRNAGGSLVDRDGPVEGETATWPFGRIVVPVKRDLLPYLGVAALVLALAAALVVMSERQLRAQERASLEQQLAQSDRLQALGLLTAGIAHEINNPLEGIANWLAVGNVERAQEGFDRIRAIVRDLLNFARARRGEEHAELEPCLRRAVELARMGKITVDDRTEPHVTVRGAPHAIEQVFLNLLLNAGQAGARNVTITSVQESANVYVHFTDDGPGIAEADLPRLFDPFFTRTGGTGLGLSVSYGLARAMGGSLAAANVPGGGARMTVELMAK